MLRRHFVLHIRITLREYWSVNKRDEMAGQARTRTHAHARTRTHAHIHTHRILI